MKVLVWSSPRQKVWNRHIWKKDSLSLRWNRFLRVKLRDRNKWVKSPRRSCSKCLRLSLSIKLRLLRLAAPNRSNNSKSKKPNQARSVDQRPIEGRGQSSYKTEQQDKLSLATDPTQREWDSSLGATRRSREAQRVGQDIFKTCHRQSEPLFGTSHSKPRVSQIAVFE